MEKKGYAIVFKPTFNTPENPVYGIVYEMFPTAEKARAFAEEMWDSDCGTWYVAEMTWKE